MESKWRIVDSNMVSPEFSVAADEAILSARNNAFVPNTLHFYIRELPTISLGHNRSVEDSVNLDAVNKLGISIIRRFSGGSAIYTDKGQLIFSLIIDQSLLPSDIVKSYEMICSAVISGLLELEIDAVFKPVNDIMVDGCKISGSAQLRRKNSILHHGTILVDTDLEPIQMSLKPAKKKNVSQGHVRLTTLSRVLGYVPEMNDVKKAIISGMKKTFGVSLIYEKLTDWELYEIERLIREKYGNFEWNWKL